MELKAGEPIKHSYFGSFQLNYEIESLHELQDHLLVRKLIFADGIIYECKDIDDWSLGKIKLFIDKGLFWDIKEAGESMFKGIESKVQGIVTDAKIIKEEVKKAEYNLLTKMRRLGNISALICFLSFVGMILSVVVFVWWTFILALKVLITSIIIYFIFWVINKAVKPMIKELETRQL
jgi:hypothetical protein